MSTTTTTPAPPPPAPSVSDPKPRRGSRGVVRAVVRALAGGLATTLAASFLIFAALSFTPGDPVDQVVGARATAEQREVVRQELGLDQPVPIRYVEWVGDAVQGDFGRSITYRQEVGSLIEPRVGTTLMLVGMAAVIIIGLGVAIGAFGGTSERWRPVVSALIGVGISIPSFVAATILIAVFAVQLGWFPTFGSGEGFVDKLHHLALPAVALSLGWTAYVAQMTTVAVREQADRDHVVTAVGRGLSRGLIFRRHVLRNASLPVLTASGLTVAGLVAGSVVVETAFAVDGIGSLLIKSVQNKDYPVVMAISMIIVLIFVVVTTLLDLAQLALDPRTRASGGDR